MFETSDDLKTHVLRGHTAPVTVVSEHASESSEAKVRGDALAGMAGSGSEVVGSRFNDNPVGEGGAGQPDDRGAPTAADGTESVCDQESKPMGRRAFRARSLLRWIVLGVCCCLALSAILVFRVPLGDELRLAVTHQPSLYTALSFVEPEGGSMLLSTRRANTIVFRIVNHEGGDVSYSYAVSLASRFGSSTASRGWVEIPQDGETTREIDLVVGRRHTAYVVSVVLEGRGDSIELHAVTQ